jgi:hypothetical protein
MVVRVVILTRHGLRECLAFTTRELLVAFAGENKVGEE